MPMNHLERVEHSLEAVFAYLRSKGEYDGEASIAALVENHEISDLICDLLHCGDHFGHDHQLLIEQALTHYTAENTDAEAELLHAADAVIAAWDGGDLAGAVRNLSATAAKVRRQS